MPRPSRAASRRVAPKRRVAGSSHPTRGARTRETLTLFYATNRKHEGADRWHPTHYGNKFSDDGMENLRFGRVTLDADASQVEKYLAKDVTTAGRGDGEGLAAFLAERARSATIEAYPERLQKDVSDKAQPNAKLGSQAMFADLKTLMLKNTDVLVYVHGFNVTWFEAVGSALALQLMLNASNAADAGRQVSVVLFTWPSDGLALPFVSYKSDRTEAAGSGFAFGRGLLKVRDFLATLRDRARQGEALCDQDLHLLCHSMGNYVLQNSMARMGEFTPGNAFPRLFGHIFLCAPDLDDGVLEPGAPMGRVHELARCVTVYHNGSDVALVISDHTKGNPERLGAGGAARPSQLHNKLHQVDCRPIVAGLIDHSYYLVGYVNDDIRQSIDGLPLPDARRRRERDPNSPNVWKMK